MGHRAKISFIIPVNNAEDYLEKCLEYIRSQTIQEYEIICIDAESTAGSLPFLQEAAEKDTRIRIITQQNRETGAAWNKGLAAAEADYVLFIDVHCHCLASFSEKALRTAEEKGADITAFNYTEVYPDNSELPIEAIHAQQLPEGKSVFNYKDIPDSILTVFEPLSRNKIYRTEFLRENGLKFDEIDTANEISFAAVCMAKARKITFISDSMMRYCVPENEPETKSKETNPADVICAVESTDRQIKSLSYYEKIRGSLQAFVLSIYLSALRQYTDDFRTEDARKLYTHCHEQFNSGDFDLAEGLTDDNQARIFRIIRKYSYDDFLKRYDRKIVVSLTTYPERIQYVPSVLETIFSQSVKADEIVLWLADSQFPEHEADLPEKIRSLQDEGMLTVKYCEDLKSYKKFFYAFQQYDGALIITIDDDLLYHPDMIENLFSSWLEFPLAVSAMRTHLMVIDESEGILPYKTWFMDTNVCLRQPCMQLFATGGAGAIYAPELFSADYLDEKLFMELCPDADDLWLKLMEVMSGVPVVLACPNRALRYVPGSQKTGLRYNNLDNGGNDEQLRTIQNFISEKYCSNRFLEIIRNYPGRAFINTKTLMEAVVLQRSRLMQIKTETMDRLKKSKQENQQISQKLKQTQRDKEKTAKELEKFKKALEKKERENLEIKNTLFQTREKLSNAATQNELILGSTSFKIGSAITCIPGTVKRFFVNKK